MLRLIKQHRQKCQTNNQKPFYWIKGVGNICYKQKNKTDCKSTSPVSHDSFSPNSQEIPRTGMSTVARAYKKRERQERLPLCDRLSQPYHCNSCSCSVPPHSLCLTSHPKWMTDRCLFHVHDFRQPFLRYFDEEMLSPGHHYGQLTMPNFNTTLPSAII